MKQTLKVTGMKCNDCRISVENALKAVDGVNSASVSLEKALAEVDYDPQKTNTKALCEAVDNEGFHAEA